MIAVAMRMVVAIAGVQATPTLCVVDGASGAPLVGAAITPLMPAAPVRVATGGCISLPGIAPTTSDGETGARLVRLRVARAGYTARTVDVRTGADTLTIALFPLSTRRASGDASPTMLATQRVTASVTMPGRTGTTLAMRDARERGAGTVNGLLALLPYTQLRSARGETGLSLRGARREQVVVTLDGLPLNDPATGLADISDLPLASLATAAIVPGADPVQSGSGASGGVLALTTGARREVALRTGSFGSHLAEGGWAGSTSRVRWNAAASWRTARNDFAFVNDAGVTPVRETRVNADERRLVLSGGFVAPQTQWSLLASSGERGMVGAANVRSYDADRARTDRVVTRLQQTVGGTVASLGARWFTLAYRDPTRPALDSRARAWAIDADWRGVAGPGSWRLGLGGDALRGTGASTATVTQARTRGFVAYGVQREHGALAIDAGARADAVQGSGVQPTASLGTTFTVWQRPAARVALVGRAAQAMRVPTLYDLYFASPQRLAVRALDPERVTLDASVGVTGRMARADWTGGVELLAVHRDTRNAIVWFPGNFGWSPANVGRESLRGVESRVDVARGAVRLDGWLTIYDALLHSNGLRIPTPYVPRVASGVQGLLTHGRAALSVNARHQGRRPYTAGPRNAFFELPAVWLVDAALTRRVPVRGAEALLSLSLDNLSNARWQSVRGFPMPGRAWSFGITLQPAPQAPSPQVAR